MTQETGNRWRPVIAALANPDVRVAFGLLLGGGDLTAYLDAKSPSRRAHIVRVLTASGAVRAEGGVLALEPTVFADILADVSRRKAAGIGRFLVNGRITQYPASLRERDDLLRWVAERVLEHGETVSEPVLTGRLRVLADDAALLRRYLVDAGFVDRSRDGAAYTLNEKGAQSLSA
ncbi:MAG: DUF2087 domain-containing protein [Micrococcales bacterium]|nr:DUF2087 domain-containing protein [Micrococcales bacterium]